MTAPYQFVCVLVLFAIVSNSALRAVQRVRHADREQLLPEKRYARFLGVVVALFWLVAVIELGIGFATARGFGHLFFWICTAGVPGILMIQSVRGLRKELKLRSTAELADRA